MSEAKTKETAVRKVRTLDDEILAQREKLRKLEERKREAQSRERERNIKAVLELIRAEKLDVVPAEQWKTAMVAIKRALHVENLDQSKTEPNKTSGAGKGENATISQ